MNYCNKDGFNKSNVEIRDKTSNETTKLSQNRFA